MGGGSSSGPQQVTSTTTNLPEYARPYFENLMGRAQAQSYQQYTPYPEERIAGFTPAEQQIQQAYMGLGAPSQTAVGSALAQQAGLGALMGGYTPGQFASQQVQGGRYATPMVTDLPQYATPMVSGLPQYAAPQMQAAQTGYNPALTTYQVSGPETFTTPGAAQQYMSPYMQNVVDVQKREALLGAKQQQLASDLGAARQGTYGGSRQLMAALGRERQLGQQLSDIQAGGLQGAYQAAQQQFNVEQQARQAAQQANLQAALGVQQLGTQTGLQTALANLTAAQQQQVQNQAAILQTQGLNANQALQAALANQQAALQTQQLGGSQALQAALANQQAALSTQQLGGSQALQAALANQQANLDAQRLAEQSRQFGSTQGLAGLTLAGQMGQTLGSLGQLQQQQDLARLQAQATAAAQPRTLQQQQLDLAYQDFLRQRDYPIEQLGYFSNMLRGLPVTPTSTQTTYGQAPSMLSQLTGAGLGAAGISKLLG